MVFFRRPKDPSPSTVIIVSRLSPNGSAHLIHRSRLLDACTARHSGRAPASPVAAKHYLPGNAFRGTYPQSSLTDKWRKLPSLVVVLCPSRPFRRQAPSCLPLFSTSAFSGTITHPALRISRILRRCSFHARGARCEIIWRRQNAAAFFF